MGFSALRLTWPDLTSPDSSDGFITTRLCGFQAHRIFDDIGAGMIPLLFILRSGSIREHSRGRSRNPSRGLRSFFTSNNPGRACSYLPNESKISILYLGFLSRSLFGTLLYEAYSRACFSNCSTPSLTVLKSPRCLPPIQMGTITHPRWKPTAEIKSN